MIMTALALIATGVIAYVWVMRGFFSALIHMACTIAAGAIAFGLWEPTAYWLMSVSPDRGFFSFVRDISWSFGLAFPFGLSLALLRVGIDKLLPANAQCSPVVDYVGGGACGLIAGVISAGIMVISIGMLRVPRDYMGYQGVVFTTQASGKGSLERDRPIFRPYVDEIAAGIYGHMSRASFSTEEPLDRWYPSVPDAASTGRMTFRDVSRNTLRTKDFSVVGTWTVGDWQRGQPMPSLLDVAWEVDPKTKQSTILKHGIVDMDGQPVPSGYLAGFMVQFNSGAREKTGQVVVGSGQVRLIAESSDGESHEFHPVAVVTNVDQPDIVEYARFRFDANDLQIASVGGASESLMGFEFALPPGYRPIGLYVKHARYEISAWPPQTVVGFESSEDRDRAIRAGRFPGLGGSGGQELSGTGERQEYKQDEQPPGIRVTNTIGFVIQKGTEAGLDIVEETKYNAVTDGEAKFNNSQIVQRSGTIDAKLRIDRFAVTDDTVMVKVDASIRSPNSLLSQNAALAEQESSFVLIDVAGTRYEAVGFIYQDEEKTHIRYTVGKPLKGLAELTQQGITLSRSRPEQKLELLFRVSRGVQLDTFAIGNKPITEYSPPIKTDVKQK